MGATNGLDSDVYVAALPSIALSVRENCTNYDSGVFKAYRADIHRYWDKTVVAPSVQVGTDAKQTITLSAGSPTGGTFTLTFGGNTTAAIPWNATALQVDAALELLASIGTAGVLCTGGPLPGTPITVEFQGPRGGAAQATMTHADSMTPSGTLTIASVQTGIAWVTQATTLYTWQPVGGIVTFNSALASTQAVCLNASGQYFNVSQLANCSSWELDEKAAVIDTTIFQQSGWGASQAAMKTATGKISSFVPDGSLVADMGSLMVFVLYLVKTTGIRFECYGWIDQLSPKGSMAGVLTQDITFVVDGQVFMYTAP